MNDSTIERKKIQLFVNNKDLIDKFLEITERKVSVLDDYGDENWEALSTEIFRCIKKISDRENLGLTGC